MSFHPNFESLKKQGSKIRRFFLRMLLFFLLFLGLCTLLLRNKAVQTYAAKRAARYLSAELKTKVEIESIELDFFKNAHIENAFMADQTGDSMLYARTIDCNIDDFSTATRKILINTVSVTGVYVKIGKHKGEKDKNIDFLVEYFNPPRKKPRTTPKKIWSIYFQNVDIDNSYFEQFDDRKPEPVAGLLDQYHLQFSRIKGTLENLWLVDDSLNFHCRNLTALERSGLFINTMKADCIIYNEGMDFTDLEITTGCSRISDELHFRYPGYKYLDEFVSNTKWRGHLENSIICLKELSIFNSSIANHKELIEIKNADLLGTFDNLRIADLSANLPDKSFVEGNFEMQGLPDWRTTHIEFDVKKLTTDKKDLSKLLNGMELPNTLDKFGKISFTGTLSGRFLDFVSSGKIETDLGVAITDDLEVNMSGPLEEARITGQISSESFNLSALTDNQIQSTGFNLELDLTGFTPSSFKADIKTEVSNFNLLNKNYPNGFAEGVLTLNSFKGKAGLMGESSNAEFDGEINFGGKSPAMQFQTHLENFNLAQFGLPGKPIFLSSDVLVDLKGNSINTMVGKIELNEVDLVKEGVNYHYNSIRATKTEETFGTYITFDGDLVQGDIKGRLDVSHFADIIQNTLAPVFVNQIKPSKYKGFDSLTFNLNFIETKFLSSFVDKKINISKFKVNGNINSRTNIYKLISENIEYLTYDNISLRNFKITSNKPNESFLNFRIENGQLFGADNQMLFKDITLITQAQPYYVDLKLNFSHAQSPIKANLVANTMLFGDSIPITFSQTQKSKISFAKEELEIAENASLVFYQGKIFCRNIRLSNKKENEFIDLNGTISESMEDKLFLNVSNIGFDKIKPFIPGFTEQDSLIQSFNGIFSGSLNVASVLKNPEVDETGFISAKKIKFAGKNWGKITINALQKTHLNEPLNFIANFDSSALAGDTLLGMLNFKENVPELFNLTAKIHKKSSAENDTLIYLLNPFIQDIITIKHAKVYGAVNIKGNANKYNFNGTLMVDSAKLKVDYLNTWYTFSNAEFELNPQGIFTKKIKVTDEKGTGTANISMALKHQGFKNSNIDVRVTEVKNLYCLNTTEKMNDIFYGQGYADGSCTISGPFDRIDMDIKGTTKKGTDIKLLYSDVEENKSAGFIRYETKGTKIPVETKKESSSIHKIAIELNATPDAKAEFIIDPYTKDIISGRGTGLLKMVYDEFGEFTLAGTYTISSGIYSFSIPYLNVIKQDLAIEPGGTLKWKGDPFDCNLNVTGYVKRKLSPNVLMETNSSTNKKSYPQILFVAKLNMTGNLFSPKISFDLDAPEIKNATDQTNTEVNARIQAIRNNPDETSKQVMALIVTNSFFPTSSSNVTSQSFSAVSGTLGNSLSSIANDIVGKYLFEKLGLKGVHINVAVNQLGSSGTSSNTTQFFTLGLESDWRFGKFQGNFNINYNTGINNYTGEININFNNPNMKGKIFSRPSNLLSVSSIGGNYTQTGQTFGLGIGWRKEFERNVFRK